MSEVLSSRVKLSLSFGHFPILRQTPGGRGIWGNYAFVLDPQLEQCDAWVVYNNLDTPHGQMSRCPPNRTLLLIGEPPSRMGVNAAYASQFSVFVGCHPAIDHPGLIRAHQGLPWWVGVRRLGAGRFEARMGYDELAAMRTIEKSKLLSVVCSNLIITPEHRKRVRFVQRLAQHFGDRLALYGAGFRPIEDKWDAIAPYKYHIVLENSCVPNYWTEKLADAFLGGALPIYHGCPNIERYFAAESLVRINIDRPQEAIEIIEQVLAESRYERVRDAIWESRWRVLDEHNLFALVARLLDSWPMGERENVVIHPAAHFPEPFRWDRLYAVAREGIQRAWFKVRDKQQFVPAAAPRVEK